MLLEQNYIIFRRLPNFPTLFELESAAGFEFHDTLAASRRHFGCRLPNHQLQTVAVACGYELVNHHHALADAEACAVIAMQLL